MSFAAAAPDLSVPSAWPLRVQTAATARAPMRISLAGGGTDVPPIAKGIGGRVVCASVDLHVQVTVEPFDPGWVRLEGLWGLADMGAALAASPPPGSFHATAPHATTGSSRSPSHATVAHATTTSRSTFHATAPHESAASSPRSSAMFTRRRDDDPSDEVGFRLLEAVRALSGVEDGVRILVESDLTPGTGLGGSAAAAVALLAAFDRALGRETPLHSLASEASLLEREILGLRCGLQDQLCAAAGGFLDIRFFDDGFDVGHLAPPPALVRDLAAGLLLVDTRVRRVSGDILTLAPEDDAHDLVAAADDTARGFRLGSLPLVLAGMRRSASAKLRRGGPSALPWDWVRRLSCLGAVVVRACGAGGGGHVLLWVDPSHHEELIRAVEPCIVRRPTIGVPGVTILHV